MLARRCITGAIIVLIVGVCVSCATTGNKYRPASDVRESLKSEQLHEVDGKRYFGQAWMEKRGELYILHLKGSPYERGYQHGVLLREEIKLGVVKEYADIISQGRGGFSFKNWLLGKYLDYKVYKPLEKAQPKDLLAELKGIADGSGMPYETIFKANHDTAVSMTLMPVFIHSRIKELQKMGIDVGACSTFVATREAALNGKTVVGRNTDYHGLGGWPRYQTVMFVEPDKGFKHVRMGTAGILMWTPGMNEKGIVFCQHFMIYDDCQPHGWNIAAFTDEILRKANSVESALDLIRNNPRGASCGFVITDGKTKEAVAVEVSTSSAAVRHLENGALAMTNMAVSQEKKPIDFVDQYNLNEGCPARYFRLMQLIREHQGGVDPELAAAFMGDHIRYPVGVERTTHGVVGVCYNVNSMVFSPEDLKLWVAAGPAPMCNNRYFGFDFQAEMNGAPSKIEPAFLNGYKFQSLNKRMGMYKYNQAFILYEHDPEKEGEILSLIREAARIDPTEPIYLRMIAKFLLYQKKYDEAIEQLQIALPLKQSLNETAQNYLLLGILSDLKNDRQQALAYYQKIDALVGQEGDDPWFRINRVLLAYKQKYQKRPFCKKDIGDNSVLLGFAQDSGIE